MSLLLPHEIEAMKRNIEAQLDEYEQELDAYRAWVADYLRRTQPAQEPAE